MQNDMHGSFVVCSGALTINLLLSFLHKKASPFRRMERRRFLVARFLYLLRRALGVGVGLEFQCGIVICAGRSVTFGKSVRLPA